MQVAKVFTIAPGAPFLKTFLASLLEGRVVGGFSKDLGPLEMAETTIYVPTRRAARALAGELARAIGRPSIVLPRILPLGALEETETSLLFDEDGLSLSEPGLPQAASEIESPDFVPASPFPYMAHRTKFCRTGRRRSG